MKKLIIFGNGGHGKSVLDCALSLNDYSEIAFLIDRDKEKVNTISNFENFYTDKISIDYLIEKYENIVIALGDNTKRIKKMNYYKELGFKLETIIHSSAVVSKLSEVGEGSVIMANASVNAFSCIGRGCIINTKVNVDHDSKIGEGTHLSPGVSMGGNVKIGKKTWLGVGCVVRNGIIIGDDSLIGMGSVVTKNIGSGKVAYGCPCKEIRGNN